MGERPHNPFLLSTGPKIGAAAICAPSWPATPSSSASTSFLERAALTTPLQLEVKEMKAGRTAPPFIISIPRGACVSDLRIRVLECVSPGPVTIIYAGKKLTCQTDVLADLGLQDGQSVVFLRIETPPGPSLTGGGTAPIKTPPPFGSVGTNTPAPSALTSVSSSQSISPMLVKVRLANDKTIDVPFQPSMTGVGLKRELERLGEGSALALRLLAGGRELVAVAHNHNSPFLLPHRSYASQVMTTPMPAHRSTTCH